MDRLTRTLAVLALLASGCRIGDVTFTPLGGGDDGGPDDGSVDDSMMDAGANQPLTRGFLIDQGAGIWSLNKNAQTGDLTLAFPTPFNGGNQPNLAAANRTGTHLYVTGGVTAPELRDYPVNGTTIGNNPNSILMGSCSARSITVHPNGRFLFIGCTNQTYARLSIDTNGAIIAGSRIDFTAEQGPMFVAFSPSGKCLVVIDANGPNPQRVRSHLVDPTTGDITPTPATTGSSGVSAIAIHPSNRSFYVTSGAQVTTYTLEPNTCESAIVTGTSLNASQATNAAVLDPSGGRLFLLSGNDVRSYNIDERTSDPEPGQPIPSGLDADPRRVRSGRTVDDLRHLSRTDRHVSGRDHGERRLRARPGLHDAVEQPAERLRDGAVA